MKRSRPQTFYGSDDSEDDDYKYDINSSQFSESNDSIDVSDNISDEPCDATTKSKRKTRSRKPLKESAKKVNSRRTKSTKRSSSARRKSSKNPRYGKQQKRENKVVESDNEDESRKEALWAGFLKDTKPTANTSSKLKNKNESPKNGETVPTKAPISMPTNSKICGKNDKNKPHTRSVGTDVDDFSDDETNGKAADNMDASKIIVGIKRPPSPANNGMGSSRGLGTVLNQIGKRKKLSVLEKTQLDWNDFKHDEGIEEELQTFNRGRDGFLDRQDFLQRTDMRQFEIEKNLRHSRRKH